MSRTLMEFEEALLPHLDAAFNLARHLTRDDHEAEDVVQDACLRALKYFESFRGGSGRAWLLQIVRHTFYTRRRRARRAQETITGFDDDSGVLAPRDTEPERRLNEEDAGRLLREAMAALPPAAREIIVLRELEGLSYRAIGRVTGVPVGTVMSRLARARERLRIALAAHIPEAS